FTPDLMPSDVTGTEVLTEDDSGKRRFQFRPGPIFANVVLADEINRATPKTQSSLLEAMEEHQATVLGQTYPLEEPFFVLATQNPIELEGTYPLPEAQLDRFLMKIPIGYPSEREENDILLRFERHDPLETLENMVAPETILEMQAQVREIRVEQSVREYIVQVCRTTRLHEDIELGASPRATMALYRTCQALAAIRGRAFVIPDDVKMLVPYVLTHRLVINPQTRLRGRDPEAVIRDVVETVPVPVEA
ncbi:MAG: MoxR family ATPase, partial [Anaerolineales bacterium]|nr:MoxR family ATPase [Anaerolineales bacterium]